MKIIERILAAAILLLILQFSIRLLSAQELPDSPSVKKCGPKWAGGCFVAPNKSNWETVKDPYFLWPTVLQWSLMGADMGITIRGIDASKGCLEGNTFLGKNPSNGRVIGWTLVAESVATAFRFVAAKTVPDKPHNRVEKIARWISPSIAFYSVYQHGNGIRKWTQTRCL